jgi:hypothetical protein
MRELSHMIDTTRFFDGGRMKIKINRVMSKPLPARLIESTERETNLSRLREWVGDNVVAIDGNLAIRVGEPSLRLMASDRDKHGTCALWIMREELLPDIASYNPGIHFSLDEKETVRQFAKHEVNTNPLADSWKTMIDDGVIEQMQVGAPTEESMHERTLRSLAAAVVANGPRGRNGGGMQHHFDYLDTLNDMPNGRTDDGELDQMMSNLVVVSRNISQATSILVEMAAERWEDRPVSAINLAPRRMAL